MNPDRKRAVEQQRREDAKVDGTEDVAASLSENTAECRLLLLSDGRILAHNLTPELHQVLSQLFPET